MSKRKLLQKILAGSKNIRFGDMVRLAEAFGFRLAQTDGSHHIFVHPEIAELVNLMQDYHINIFYSEEDGGYIADIPDLEACSAFGRTPAEALEQVQKAKDLWLEAARVEGKRVRRHENAMVVLGMESLKEAPDGKTIVKAKGLGDATHTVCNLTSPGHSLRTARCS